MWLRDDRPTIIGFRNLEPRGRGRVEIFDPILVTLDAEGDLVARSAPRSDNNSDMSASPRRDGPTPDNNSDMSASSRRNGPAPDNNSDMSAASRRNGPAPDNNSDMSASSRRNDRRDAPQDRGRNN